MGEPRLTNNAEPHPHPRPRVGPRIRRRLLLALVALVLFVLVLVLLMPTLVSTGPGTRAVLKLVNRRIPGSIEAGDLSIGWFSGQGADGLKLLDPDGEAVIAADLLRLPDASLWSLLWGGLALGELRAQSVEAHLVKYDDGTTNLKRVFAAPAPEPAATTANRRQGDRQPTSAPSLPGELSLALRLADATVSYAVPDREPVVLSLAKVHVDVSSPRLLAIDLEAKVRQGKLAGSIQAAGRVDNLFDSDGRLRIEQAQVEATTAITDLPIAAIDQMFNQGGRLASLLGPTLTMNLRATGTIEKFDAALTAHGQHLSARGEVEIGSSGLKGKQMLTLTLTPEAWQTIIGPNRVKPSRLINPVVVRMSLEKLAAPVDGSVVAWADAAVGLNISIDDVVLDVDGVGRVAFGQMRGAVATDRLGDALVADFTCTAAVKDSRGEIRLDAVLRNLFLPDGRVNRSGFATRATAKITNAPIAVALDELFAFKPQGVLTHAVGPIADVRLEVNLRPLASAAEETASPDVSGPFRLAISSPFLDADFVGWASTESIELGPPSVINFQVRPQLLESAQQTAAKPADAQPAAPLGLAEPALLTINVEHLHLPIADFKLQRIAVALTATVDRIVPAGDQRLAGLVVRDLAVKVPRSRLGEDLALVATATVQYHEAAATLESRNVLRVLSGAGVEPTLVRSDTTIKAIPVELVKALAPAIGQYVPLLGPRLDELAVSLVGDPRRGPDPARKPATFSTFIKSSTVQSMLTGAIALDRQETAVSLNEGSFAELRVAPKWFNRRLAGKHPNDRSTALELAKPTTIRLDIKDCSLVVQAGVIDPSRFRLAAAVSIPQSQFRILPDRTLVVRDATVELATADLRAATTVTASAAIEERGDDTGPAQPGRLKSTTTITGLWGPAGRQDLRFAAFSTETHAERLSLALVEALLGQEGMLTAIGPVVTVDLSGSVPGVLDLRLEADTAKVTLPLQVSEQRELTLRKDAVVELDPTPQMFATVLGKIQPIFADAVAAEKPIRLLLNYERINIPLKEFEISKVRLQGTLHLGTLRMKRQGWVTQGIEGMVNEFFSKAGEPRSKHADRAVETYLVTFTPLDFTINKGFVRPSELWMTSSDLAIGFQGVVDLNPLDHGKPGQIKKMAMGVMGASLIYGWDPKLADYVKPDDIADLPVTGTIDAPKVDRGVLLGDLVGGALSREAHRRLPELGNLIDHIGDTLKRKRRHENRLEWNPPKAATEFARRVTESLKQEPPDESAQRSQKANARELTPEQRRKRRERRQQRRQQKGQEQAPP